MYHPNRPGFFPLLFEKFKSSIPTENPSASLTLEERLKHVWKSVKSADPFKSLILLRGGKCSKTSQDHRESGNAFFYDKDYKNAIMSYTLAVCIAPTDSRDQVLALANRSAALQRTNSFKEALMDINCALNSKVYPAGKEFKLHERKAEIYEFLLSEGIGEKETQLSNLKISCQDALTTVKKSDLKQQKMLKFESEIKSMLARDFSKIKANSAVKEDKPTDTSFIHPDIEMKYNECKGRYMVASKDIPPGETLVLEIPATYTLHPDKMKTHCTYCFSSNMRTAYPCGECIWVSYCSYECRNKGKKFHQYECGINKWLLESGLNVYPYLSLRMITKVGFAGLMEIKNSLFETRDETNIPQTSQKMHDFVSHFNLKCHESFLSDEEWHIRSFISLFLVKCLKLTNFFLSPDKTDDFTDEEFYVGSVIFQLLNTSPTNCHDISEYSTPIKGEFASIYKKESVGAAVYPMLALFNHSCESSFMRCNIGNKVWCVSNKMIRKGEEIFENYGLMFTAKPLSERQQVLKSHYKFVCQCLPCQQNWPDVVTMKQNILNDKNDRFLRLRCQNCDQALLRTCKTSSNVHCTNCGSDNDVYNLPINELKMLSEECQKHFTRGEWDQGMSKFIEADALMREKKFEHPSFDFIDSQIALWKGMWIKEGNMRIMKIK